MFTKLFSIHFKNKLTDLCLEPVANFVVQKLIDCAKNAFQTECIVDELQTDLAKLLCKHRLIMLIFLVNQRSGVVEKLFKAAGTHKTRTGELLVALYKALELSTENKEQAALLIDCIVTNRQVQYAKNLHYPRATSLHGCLIAQHILNLFPDSDTDLLTSR
jgi:hypothetical protein